MSGEPHIIVRLFGAMLMAVGGLMVMLCGLCSAAGLVMAIETAAHGSNGSSPLGMITLIIVVGGVPIAIGVGVFLWGQRLFYGK